MAIDLDAALARMHAACDETFAKPAIFRPRVGPATPCRIEIFAPMPAVAFGEAQASVEDCTLRVMRAALTRQPVKGDMFDQLNAENVIVQRFRVIAAATIEDDDGLRWTVRVERVS